MKDWLMTLAGLLVIVALLFFSQYTFAKEESKAIVLDYSKANSVKISNKIISQIKVTGSNLYQKEDFSMLLQNYLGQTISDSLQEQILNTINNFYYDNGYYYSYVAEINFKNNILSLRVLEGYVREVVIDQQFRNEQVDFYIEQIKSIKPFNWKEAEQYFVLLKRSPGIVGKMRITPVILSPLSKIDPTNPATVDVVIDNYFFKVFGILSLDNRYKNYTPDVTTDSQGNPNIQYGGSNFLQLNTQVNNLYNLGNKLSTTIVTSGSKEDSSISIGYSHPLNFIGTNLITKVGGSFVHIPRKQKLRFVDIAIEHPLYLSLKESLDINIHFYSYSDTKISATSNNINIQEKTSPDKILLGASYKLKDDFGGNHFYNIEYHQSLKVRETNIAPEFDRTNFKKIKFGAETTYQIFCNDCKINLDIAGQYSKNNLLLTEIFNIGLYRGGRGFSSGEIYGDKGISGSIEFSKTTRVEDHLMINGHREYIYIDAGIVANKKESDYKSKSSKLLSIGIGTEIMLIDNLMFTIEYSKPCVKKVNSTVFQYRKKPGSRIFLGLEYIFAF